MATIKRAKSSYVLIAGLLGTVVVGAWLFYTVAANLIKSQQTEVQKRLISPLDGSVREKSVENLDLRRQFTNTELNAVILSNNVPAITVASESGTLNNRQ